MTKVELLKENERLRKENERLVKELDTSNRDLTEALDRRTATAEILQLMSSSATEVQPVFEAIARRAMSLCEGALAIVVRYEGEMLHLAAHAHATAEGAQELVRRMPQRPGRGSMAGRAVLDRVVVHIPDVGADPEYDQRLRTAFRVSSGLAVPILREGQPVGAISVGRFERRPFTDGQIALLRDFADQAVIAIENVRLFKETKEALEQQTATSEILRVISSSPTDVEPVFDTIIKNAVRLCDAQEGSVFRFDGQLIHLVASETSDAALLNTLHRVFPRAPGWDSPTARAILTRAVTHVPDIAADQEYTFVGKLEFAPRTILSVPILRDGEPIGAITVARRDVKSFSDTQIVLLETFASQAVIAVENVRLFTELQARNADLTDALARQTATSDILGFISSSPKC